MTAGLITAYVLTAFTLVVTPGATTTVVIRQALRAGRRGGAAAAFGAAFGNSTHALSAGLGVTVLARRWPAVLSALTLAGGAYLCWLGLTSIVRGLRADRALAAEQAPVESGSSFRAGLTVTLLNPSAVTFYLTVLPAFLPAGSGVTTFALLAGIHIVLAFCCHNLWAVMFSRLGTLFARTHNRRRLDIAAGAALLGFGIWTVGW